MHSESALTSEMSQYRALARQTVGRSLPPQVAEVAHDLLLGLAKSLSGDLQGVGANARVVDELRALMVPPAQDARDLGQNPGSTGHGGSAQKLNYRPTPLRGLSLTC